MPLYAFYHRSLHLRLTLFFQVEFGSLHFPGGGIERAVIKHAHLLHFVRKTEGSAAQPGSGSSPAASHTVGSCPGAAGAPHEAPSKHNCSQLAGVNRQMSPKNQAGSSEQSS